VVKNLCDPVKAQDPKYRQLKLDNEKVRAKILACSAAVPLLQALGFVESMEGNGDDNDNDNTRVLRMGEQWDAAVMTNALDEITSTLAQLDNGNTQNKKPRTSSATTNINSTTNNITNNNNTVFPSVESKLTEKQKARRLLEEKQERERELAKQQRKHNVAMLKQDKFVRQNDENWTSGVSAACAKSGDSISTFRDKFGE
jgi:hypothetical protein